MDNLVDVAEDLLEMLKEEAMTTPSPFVQDYVRSARFHLDNAFGMYTQVREQQYNEAFVKLAYMASRYGVAALIYYLLLCSSMVKPR